LICARDSAHEPSWCQRWNAIYAAMQNEGTTASLARVARYLADHPQDGVAKYHFERLRAAGGQRPSDVAI
jgi:adenylate cyclase